MKLTAVTVKQSTSVNLNGLENCVQMNAKDLSGTEIVKRCWEAYHNFSWDQKKVVDRESRLIATKIKETIHSLKNPNHINKISYMLPGIWLPNLR